LAVGPLEPSSSVAGLGKKSFDMVLGTLITYMSMASLSGADRFDFDCGWYDWMTRISRLSVDSPEVHQVKQEQTDRWNMEVDEKEDPGDITNTELTNVEKQRLKVKEAREKRDKFLKEVTSYTRQLMIENQRLKVLERKSRRQ
jgi:hypothetical protein